MFCDSHYISRFAAFFIVARAKRSTVESFDFKIRSDETPSSIAAHSADTHLHRHGQRLWVTNPPHVANPRVRHRAA
jgi:hypothetical protein